jgi:hypothetical protein
MSYPECLNNGFGVEGPLFAHAETNVNIFFGSGWFGYA